MYGCSILHWQGSKKWHVVHVHAGVCVHVNHLQTAFADYGTLHAITARLKEAEEAETGQGAKIKKMEQAMCRAWTRYLRKILWVGESYRTINALQKGKSRAFFHRARCNAAARELYTIYADIPFINSWYPV